MQKVKTSCVLALSLALCGAAHAQTVVPGGSGSSGSQSFANGACVVDANGNLACQDAGFAGNVNVMGAAGLGVGIANPGQRIHLTNGNFLIEGGGETAVQMKRDGTVGTQSNPIFEFGRIISGGINLPDWRVVYTDDTNPERPIWSQESSGTIATIADNQLRSMFESYEFNGQVDPMFREQMFTGLGDAGFQVELGRIGGRAIAGSMVRSGSTVTVTTDQANTLATGDSVDLGYVGSDDPLFAHGAFTITRTSPTVFTYTQAGTAGSNTLTGYFSVPTDAKLRNCGQNSMCAVVGAFGSETTALTMNATGVTASGTLGAANLSGTNSGDLTLAAVGSSPSANGASLSGQALTLQPADGTHAGLVTAGTQTIGGNKTFSGSISASGLTGVDVSFGAVGSSPSANGATVSANVVTLQPADGTHPGLLSTGAQTFAGTKTLTNGATVSAQGSNKSAFSIASGDCIDFNGVSPGSTSTQCIMISGGFFNFTGSNNNGIETAGTIQTNRVSAPQFNSNVSTIGMSFQSTVTSGNASGGAYSLSTNHTLSGGSDLLLNVQNNGTTKFSLGADGTPNIPTQAAATGTRYLCIDISGHVTSSASACSGT